MSFRTRLLPAVLAAGLLLPLAVMAPASGVAADPDGPDHGHGWSNYDPADGPLPEDQHGPTDGHLLPTQHNVDLVSKLELTTIDGGIADVSYFKGYAYLNAWAPNCVVNGGTGGGVHVVDLKDPKNPQVVGFLPAGPNEYPGEGLHIMEVDTPFFKGDLLLHNNEPCDSGDPSVLGASIWDVTDPLAPVKIGQFGDAVPPVGAQTYHSIHSVQGFTQKDKAFAVIIDNNELADVDIIDITNPAAPVFATEQGLENWPGAQGPYANGDTVFHHDVQFKRIDGHDYLAASYWDAGQVLLNVDNPYLPVFVGDSDYLTPDPENGFAISEGNSHESYWSSNSRYLLSSDEDFSPFRTLFEMTTGPNAGPYGAGEFGFTPSVESLPGSTLNGPTVFGGRGCVAVGPNAGPDAVGDPAPPPPPPVGPDEEATIVFSRGGCFFSTKIAAGQDAGYDAVIIGQSHGGTRDGLLKDAFFCGGQGHDYDEQIPAICIGHRVMHLMFNTPENYIGPDGADIPHATPGEMYEATTVFDGWGYVNLHDATDPNLPIIGTYAVPEAMDHRYADDFGALSVHEVKTDPRKDVNLAYFSYYAAGFRVAEFGAGGITEVGRFIDEGGNDFWGVFPIGDESEGHGYKKVHVPGKLKELILASDRDYGLYIFDYTGDKPKKEKKP